MRLRFDQERGTAGDVRLQQADAFLGRVPALDDDVAQLFAQKFVDRLRVRFVDFEEVRERAQRLVGGVGLLGAATARLEQILDRFGRVGVVADEPFERTPATVQRGCLAAQLVSAALRLRLLGPALLDLQAELGDLELEPLQPVLHRFERQLHLPALHTERLQLFARRARFGQ